MNTLAVLFAGEFRTWTKCADYMFRFFEGRAEQIDYFFATWSTSLDLPGKTILNKDVVAPFEQRQKNLVSHIIIPQIGRKNSTFYNQAYLAKSVNILKRENEIKRGFVYDQVVETRPDIYIRRTTEPWNLMNDYEFCNCNYITKSQQGFDQIDDIYYRTNSFTNDILANRYWHRKPKHHYVQQYHNDVLIELWHNHHCMIMEYCKRNSIKFMTNSADFSESHIAVRQAAIDVDFDNGKIEELKTLHQPPVHSWQNPDTRMVIWH